MHSEERFKTIDEIRGELGDSLESLGHIGSTKLVHYVGYFVYFLFILSVIGALFIPWVQTVQGYGRVIAYSPNDRQQNINAPVEGQIIQWYISEGSKVKKGDQIVEIADIDPMYLERVEKERDAAKAKLLAAERSMEASRKNVERQKTLFAQGLSSKRAYELAEIEEAKSVSEVASASAELLRAESKLARQASQRIIAPRDGIIQRVFTPQGGVLVKQGDILATIVPDTLDRAVELYINGNDMPIVSVGRPVRIQFEGWPAVQFSGWPSLAIGTFGGTIALIDPSDSGNGKFRILIIPDNVQQWPSPQFLRQGVRAVGWINLDTVQLGWELWRRFNAFPITPPHLVDTFTQEAKK